MHNLNFAHACSANLSNDEAKTKILLARLAFNKKKGIKPGEQDALVHVTK